MRDDGFNPDIYDAPIPLLPLRNGVLFPGTITSLAVGRPRSLALLREVIPKETIIAVALQRDSATEDPVLEDLHPIGTLARVVSIQRHGNNVVMCSLQGLSRIEIRDLKIRNETWSAEIAAAPDTVGDLDEARFLAESLREKVGQTGHKLATRLSKGTMDNDPGRFADRVAAALELNAERAVAVLEERDVRARLRLVSSIVTEFLAVREIRKRIDAEVKKQLSQHQRETILREQLKAIKKELGEDIASATDELKERLDGLDLPEAVRTVVNKEMTRLSFMNPSQAEANVVRTYLEWVADLPWSTRAEAETDVAKVRAQLDADHFGLEEPKKRILEHLAVLKIAPKSQGTILCLVGPPGTGKTSIGASIAEATGRPFARLALGGVRDEAEIRGHRRTYVGARPGRLVTALKEVGAKNPVILLDEVDKLGQWLGGSPEAALLEVLDPEQNHTFTDHYLELPFDLSEVLFICTANQLDGISAPLRDRLEIVEVSGYTREEKIEIAQQHLLPRKLSDHGLHADAVVIDNATMAQLIRGYTREAGVRQLGRELTRLCRAQALRMAEAADGTAPPLVVTADDLHDILGKERYLDDLVEQNPKPGMATGLAWTAVGGKILVAETSLMPGKGEIVITGQLGDIMRESARAALSYVRSHADELGIDAAFLIDKDLHIHFPAGAVPKDGPSAGITIFTALVSLLTGRPMEPRTAMTGEATLRGRILPVGGIKEKVLAAHRAGMTQIILPKRNARDLDDIPEKTREELQFHLVDSMSEVLQVALKGEFLQLPSEHAAPAGAKLSPPSS